jgi:hypothetical protein
MTRPSHRPILSMRLLPLRYAVVQLEADAALPAWWPSTGLRHASWAADELSLVCEETCVPAEVRSQRGWRALKLQGPFAFELTGILLAVLQPLADAGVGIFALSTFNTDYVLVQDDALAAALAALRAHGHQISEG